MLDWLGMKKKLLPLSLIIMLGLITVFVIFNRQAVAPSNQSPQEQSSQNTETVQPAPQTPDFNKNLYSTTDPTSPWVIVNKVSTLPSTYAPTDLVSPSIGGSVRKQAADSLNRLVAAATAANIGLGMLSSYRSYNTQISTYNGYVAKDGKTAADTYSARPGHSEHQSGWAVDLGNGVCNLEICFGDTAAGKWLAAHAHEYGFIVRYPAGKEAITGYQYEPWHIRYVGPELAGELYRLGQTMEEFFDVVPSPQPY